MGMLLLVFSLAHCDKASLKGNRGKGVLGLSAHAHGKHTIMIDEAANLRADYGIRDL